MITTREIFGIVEHISLPSLGIFDIPAKIDTGAFSGAVHATNIKEITKNGKKFLSFVLPATGEQIEIEKFSNIYVRSSNGHQQKRYLFDTTIMINNIEYPISIGLSDRTDMNYEILIGRRFLHDHNILVDVKRNHEHDMDRKKRNQSRQSVSDLKLINTLKDTNIKSRPIVVLTANRDSNTVTFFENVSKKLKEEVRLSSYRDLTYKISESGNMSVLMKDGLDISQARAVYFKSHIRHPEHAAALATYLDFNNVAFFDKEVLGSVSRSKLTEMFKFASAGVPVPKSNIYSSVMRLPKYEDIASEFGSVFVIKDITSNKGKLNYLVSNDSDYALALSKFDPKATIIVQKYIESEGFLRILMFGNDVVKLVFRESASHKDKLRAHLNKPMGGANARELEPSECGEAIQIAQKAKKIMNRDIVGVDLIQDKISKKWYVLEANNNPEIVGSKIKSKLVEKFAELIISYEDNRR